MQRTSFVLMAAFAIVGCDKIDQQREALDTADKRVKAGAYRDAIRSYESALDGTAKTADVHYKIAVLYDDKLKEPLDAIHHYDRYLELSPSGGHAKEATAGRTD